MSWCILAEHRSHFHDRSRWLQILLWEWIAQQLLHLWCKSFIQNLQNANHTWMRRQEKRHGKQVMGKALCLLPLLLLNFYTMIDSLLYSPRSKVHPTREKWTRIICYCIPNITSFENIFGFSPKTDLPHAIPIASAYCYENLSFKYRMKMIDSLYELILQGLHFVSYIGLNHCLFWTLDNFLYFCCTVEPILKIRSRITTPSLKSDYTRDLEEIYWRPILLTKEMCANTMQHSHTLMN